jgi:hypothetical protein
MIHLLPFRGYRTGTISASECQFNRILPFGNIYLRLGLERHNCSRSGTNLRERRFRQGLPSRRDRRRYR